ncbi:cell wall binding repeat family protein [Bacillus clarus]|uniref:Cell wall binding repeat family protein n=1 Tax=Bacillus clarus TaxID=2338372 RepID=A0A090YB01_9BACI|nr:cell wall binding repeat family protein [Bacillus clarus]
MEKGWKQINGKWYYFSNWGDMIANGSYTIDGKSYYFNADGSLRE